MMDKCKKPVPVLQHQDGQGTETALTDDSVNNLNTSVRNGQVKMESGEKKFERMTLIDYISDDSEAALRYRQPKPRKVDTTK